MSEYFFVLERGLEPPQDCSRQGLNLVRLPIPPPQQGVFLGQNNHSKKSFLCPGKKRTAFWQSSKMIYLTKPFTRTASCSSAGDSSYSP